MVQRGNPLNPQREYYPPRDGSWNDRSFIDLPQEGRFTAAPQPPHNRGQTIETALRDCARIPVKEFALVVQLESGEERYYSSQSLTPYQPRIFTERFKQDFHRNVRRAATEGSYPNSAYSQDGMYNEFDVESGHERRKQSSSGDSSSGKSRRHHQHRSKSDDSDDDGSTSAKRKRPRGLLYAGQYADSNDDTSTPVPIQKTQQLMIGDAAEVEKFYFVRFRDMQQSSCKVMGKAFVKLVEPKKQTHHPYTKGDIKAPPWWPNTTGENSVRHKEPDHLLKPERIRLLIHILRMIVEPAHKQCPTVQKLGLNVKKLEEVTMEAMSIWFNDKEHPENGAKRPYLREIFKIAKAEERYKNGEIDATTYFPVMHGDNNGQDGSDDELEDCVKDEDDDNDVFSASNNISVSETLVSPSMVQSQPMQAQADFRMRLPVRYHQPQIEEHQSYTDSSSFPRSVNIGFQPQSPNVHDSIRRSFASPGYQSPQQNMYGWQNNMTNGPVSSYYVTTSPQQSLTAPTPPYQLPPPNTQQNMLPPPLGQHHFDGLPNGVRQYDSGPALGSQLRTGSLGHPHHMHPGFQEYIHDNGGYGQNESELKDDQNIHHNQ